MNSYTGKYSLVCPYCNSKSTRKEGLRKSKKEIIQKFYCKNCNKYFTNKKLAQKTYPSKIILNSISYYNLGYSQQQTSKLISQKHKSKVPQKTISNWLNQYKPLTPFHKLRKEAKALYPPETIIESHKFLHNNLPYTFKLHKAKLNLIFKSRLYNNRFTNHIKFREPITSYLNKIPTKAFPHHIFRSKQPTQEGLDRSSQLKFSTLKFIKLSKNNLANKLTELALNLAKTNKQRHEAVQNFMLINDSTTIAAEIPIYLTKDDIKYFKNKGFHLDLDNCSTPITGHIDIIQIRNNLIHILDYKPDAKHQNPINQLTIYALALASRTKLDLRSIKCAWFDCKNYYEFFPLHVVYKLKKKRICKSQTRLG